MQDSQLTQEEISQLTEADWKQRLSADEYHVMREKGTERPFTGIYNETNESGIYRCKGCGAKLFDSSSKFNASCGWPSFDQGIDNDAIAEHVDNSLGMTRTEVTCSNCGAHLGHVFPDGPRETTGMRYCINSVSIDLDADTKE
ncbi:peptide-methionine (R)-S-oxide reductase MsrB [Psychrobacter sp. 16-MNA-CIBAN-0192]|uniref:peptide-methionine (R)-S-oxide reductase MsrB n=1 Tax=Psychrobacter sp. 16-MNA-CIBAN-0192 TaxID=3140448 RepID=UPI0033282E48